MLQQSLEAVVVSEDLPLKKQKRLLNSVKQKPHSCFQAITNMTCLTALSAPVVFSCGNQTRHVSQDASAALDNGERVGLTAVCQRADQET